MQKVLPFEPCNRTPLTERAEELLQVAFEVHETVISRDERALQSIADVPLDVGKEDPAEVADAATIGATRGGQMDAAGEERSYRPDEPIFSVSIGGMDDHEESFNPKNRANAAVCAEATGKMKDGLDVASGVCDVDGVPSDRLVSKEVGSANGPTQASVGLTVEELCRIKLTQRKARFAAPPSPTAARGNRTKSTASEVAAKMAMRAQRFGKVPTVSTVRSTSRIIAVVLGLVLAAIVPHTLLLQGPTL